MGYLNPFIFSLNTDHSWLYNIMYSSNYVGGNYDKHGKGRGDGPIHSFVLSGKGGQGGRIESHLSHTQNVDIVRRVPERMQYLHADELESDESVPFISSSPPQR